MSIFKWITSSFSLFIFTLFFTSLQAQELPVTNIQILQQPIFDQADTNTSIVFGEGWLVGYNVKYDCLINKVDSLNIQSAALFVISASDTVFANTYSDNSDDSSQLILNNGYSSIVPIDTLLYSDDYQFMLHVYNENGVLLQLISSE